MQSKLLLLIQVPLTKKHFDLMHPWLKAHELAVHQDFIAQAR